MTGAYDWEPVMIFERHQQMVEQLVDRRHLLKEKDRKFIQTMAKLIQFPEGEDLSLGQKKYLEGLHQIHITGANQCNSTITYSRRNRLR